MNEMMGHDVHEKRFSHFQVSFSYIAHFSLKSYGLLELLCDDGGKRERERERERD